MGSVRVLIACAVALVIACALLLAGGLRPFLGAPTPEQRVMSIAADLRCPVCSGESVATSDASEAVQMRAQIARELQAGEDRPQILRGFVREYGTWILYRPPGRGVLGLLWSVPVVAAAGVAAGLVRYLRTRAVRPSSAEARGAAPTGAGVAEAEPLRRRLARFL